MNTLGWIYSAWDTVAVINHNGNLSKYLVCIQLLLRCLKLCIDLTCYTTILWTDQTYLVASATSKFRATPFQIPSLLPTP